MSKIKNPVTSSGAKQALAKGVFGGCWGVGWGCGVLTRPWECQRGSRLIMVDCLLIIGGFAFPRLCSGQVGED